MCAACSGFHSYAFSFVICLLLSGFTTDHPSGRGIPRKELSKLKLIKNYLRSLIQQYRLNSLAIMSIESEISRSLNLGKVLKNIANAKIRKIRFS